MTDRRSSWSTASPRTAGAGEYRKLASRTTARTRLRPRASATRPSATPTGTLDQLAGDLCRVPEHVERAGDPVSGSLSAGPSYLQRRRGSRTSCGTPSSSAPPRWSGGTAAGFYDTRSDGRVRRRGRGRSAVRSDTAAAG
ncbi:hypothetical protein HBB16_01510 [Pseudonocardia sp. MCCB 268]|nr:hypothetical protein [Pseudonocardia cytotoxica]